jgi:hypothetical protein
MNSNLEKPIKRGRGRPPGSSKKNPALDDSKKEGIVKIPSKKNYYMELLFNDAMVWKRIFDVFKSMKTRYVKINFRKELVRFVAIGRLNKTVASFTFRGENMNRYYCKNPYEIYLQPINMLLQMKKLNSKYNNIHMYSKIGLHQEKLSMFLGHTSSPNEEIDVNIITHPSADDIIDDIPSGIPYKVRFKMNAESFKAIVKDYEKQIECIKFTKSKGQDLQIQYNFKNRNVYGRYYIPFGSTDEDKLEEMGIFMCTIHINRLLPIINFTLADTYWFQCDNSEPMMISYNYHNCVQIDYMIRIQE